MKTILAPLLRFLLVAAVFAAVLPASAALPRAAGASVLPTATLDHCSWDRPGHDPFMGDVVAAVDRYQDIPAEVRTRLKARMAKRDYDDVVSIRRDAIVGQAKARYGSAIRDMHFGADRLCRTVTRAAWSAQTQERGLVYCDGRQCILVPTVCRNVSRIARAEVANEHAEGEFAEPMMAAVATIDPEPAPLPLDALPEPIAFGSDPAAEPTGAEGSFAGDGRGFFAGFGGGFGGPSGNTSGSTSGSINGSTGGGTSGSTSGAALGSFASAAGAGSAGDAGAEKGSFGHVSSTTPGTEVAVTPVPEPESWGLMIGGLAILAARRRHSRARSSTPRDAGRSRSSVK